MTRHSIIVAAKADGKPVAKIEAKLGAAFGEGQLSLYVADLQKCSGSGLLLVLVPRHRAEEMTASVSSAVGVRDPFAGHKDREWSLATVDGERLVDSLVAQAEDVIQVAYQPLQPPRPPKPASSSAKRHTRTFPASRGLSAHLTTL